MRWRPEGRWSGTWVRGAAVGAAAVLVAGGVTAAVLVSGGCAGGGTTESAVRTDGPVPWYLTHRDAQDDATVTGALAVAGVPSVPLWHLWSGMRLDESDAFAPEVTSAALVGEVLVTVQQEGARERLVAGYAARTGELRWQRTLPPGEGGEASARAGLAVVDTGRELSVFDPGSGELRWCAALPASGSTTVHETPEGLLIADQGTEAGESRLRLLDPATGTERWALDYSEHSSAEPPAVSAGTVSVFATEVDGARSGTRTLSLDSARTLWGTTVDFPHPVVGGGAVVLLRTDAGLQGVDAQTGRVLWTSRELDEELRVSGEVRMLSGLAVLLQDREWVDELPVPSGLTAFDPATGEVRWRVEPAQLGLVDGQRVREVTDLGERLLLHTDSGGLAALETATGRVLGGLGEDGPGEHVLGEDVLGGAAGDLAFSTGGNRVTVVRLGPLGPPGP